jgi:hypothetical protein
MGAIIRVRRKVRVIPDHHIDAVIKAYLKNKRAALAKEVPTSKDTEAKDQVRVSDHGKRILFERMEERVAKKAQTDMSST